MNKNIIIPNSNIPVTEIKKIFFKKRLILVYLTNEFVNVKA